MGHFRGSKNPHFQNEATCTTFLVKMSFICMRMKNHFHIKGWALNLVLIKRPGETREWLIIKVVTELRTVSLCRIARENLVNYGDATIYYNIMIKVLVFRNYLVFDEPHFLKKLGGNLRDLLLINVWWVDIYCSLTICLTCTRWNRERGKLIYSMMIDSAELWGFHLRTAIPDFVQKPSLHSGW